VHDPRPRHRSQHPVHRGARHRPAKRIHFDLRPRAGTRDDEIERVRGLGAAEVADQRGTYGPGTGWVVFADPEGNQFCLLRSQAEVDAGPPPPAG
jgi:hypothetical protein